MRLAVLRWVAALSVVATLCTIAVGQDAPGAPPEMQGPGRGMRAFNGVAGQITAIEGSTVTVQTFRGDTARVRVAPETRFWKDRADAKFSDFKIGDRVFVAGEQGKDGVWTAQVLAQRTDGGAPGGMQFKPEDNGKTYIAGELIKVDGTKLTIRKPDNSEQVIEVDDETSFRNQRRESVTLGDIKVGDFVRGQGAVKDGVFVPKELNAGRPRGFRPPTPDNVPPDQRPSAPDSGAQNK